MALQQSPTLASGLILAVLFLALLLANAPRTAATPIYDAPPENVTETDSSGLEWSLVTGTRTLFFYSVSTKEPAIVTTGNTNVTQIISSLCDLLMQYELVSKVYGDGDLKVLIGQNLMDACRWIQSLSAAGIVELLLPETATSCSCSLEDVTFLHRHCARTKMFLTARSAYLQIRYHLQDTVENVNTCNWIDTVIPESYQDNIKAQLRIPC